MPEILIVGGLTIDRFGDGTSAPGGSVVHSGRAAVAEGSTPAFLTVAGDEPEARVGLRALAALGPLLHQASGTTTTYRHDETSGRRVLALESGTDPIRIGREVGDLAPRTALLAPIADELPREAVAALLERLPDAVMVLLVQGWLRRLEVGRTVEPRPLSSLAAELWTVFGLAHAIVLSTEDLAEDGGDPFAQALALRRHVGPRPVIVLTLGVRGYLLEDPSAPDVTAAVPRRVVEDVPTVGAGDTFGAAFAIHLARGAPPSAAARLASEAVIRLFDERRR
ncbi:MAG: carbohydrate kinase family protein [Candidatus Limnocylindria bacterium]